MDKKKKATLKKKPEFFSWEHLEDNVDNPYEAVIVLSKEARRINSVPYELQEEQALKKTTQGLIKLYNEGIKFEYTPSKKK